jgi:hypothetical protein
MINEIRALVKLSRTTNTALILSASGTGKDTVSRFGLDQGHTLTTQASPKQLTLRRSLLLVVCGLLMPPGATKAYFAIRAFNVELASVKDSHNLRRREQPGQQESSSSVALQMRMQWWRDALKEIYEDEMSVAADPILRNLSVSCWHNPVVRALAQAHQQCDLTRRFLERLIDARDYDLNVAQYSSMNEAATYAEDTISSLLYLSLECTGVSSAVVLCVYSSSN